MGELNNFLNEYERQTNTHTFTNVKPLIASNAVYWFSDGSFVGIREIEQAFNRTWEAIKNEKYSLSNIEWVGITEDLAVCIYEFQWQGKVDGRSIKGFGRGTNIIKKIGGEWKMIHEHLSSKK